MTIEKKLILAQTLLNRSKNDIETSQEIFTRLNYPVELSDLNSDEFIEIRLDNCTLTCQIDPLNGLSFKSILFPDDDNMDEYIDFCDNNYVLIQKHQWLNNQDCTTIDIKTDPVMGSYISFGLI